MQKQPWIWQHPDWPRLHWEADALAPLLLQCVAAQARLLGMAGAIGADLDRQAQLDVLLQNIITSSEIEGEHLNVESVRSSLARRLDVPAAVTQRTSARSEGLAELMLDATQQADIALTLQRLLHWHALLFPEQEPLLLPRKIRVGALRGDEVMQVVSGRQDRPVVHFEAPPGEGLAEQLNVFLTWFAASLSDATLPPLLRAGVAHFWFVTLHPFEDGNGRLTRALTDLALAQSEPLAIRLYTMSASILDDRKGYYAILESSQKATPDITRWLQWFLQTLLDSLLGAQARIERTLAEARFWQIHRGQGLSAEQIKVLNRLLDGGQRGFEGGLSAAHYQAVAKVSKATATRHLADLVEKGCLERLPGAGRSTRYQIKPA
ncbi:Fic family protein [Amantichitinum ursilacus]|uniref:Adenosine monophosphate-protein transferase SoFic n=1 Tax=Amantichitinum ursilacus TaxID=857265 RepID=A0A0N0GLN8_9NEIS|nr:Fic family protein [Amantichitinum ursilacus]KPC50175.1 Adenosine monophosphate-protein transferase SoFic [Amantichitinum ursilacus]